MSGEIRMVRFISRSLTTNSLNFSGMKNDTGVPLYARNTKHTRLFFINKLLHFKSIHGCSKMKFNEFLGLIRDVLPDKL